VVILRLHLGLTFSQQLSVESRLSFGLGLSGGNGLLVSELSGLVCSCLVRFLLGSHVSELLLVSCFLGGELLLVLSLLAVLIGNFGLHTRLLGCMSLEITLLLLLGVLACLSSFSLLTCSGLFRQFGLGNRLLQRSLPGFSIPDLGLFGVEGGLS
jgi:hypothetical protein